MLPISTMDFPRVNPWTVRSMRISGRGRVRQSRGLLEAADPGLSSGCRKYPDVADAGETMSAAGRRLPR